MQILGMIITVLAVFLILKIARKIMKVIFSIIALIGIAMSLYGDQIVAWLMTLLSQKG